MLDVWEYKHIHWSETRCCMVKQFLALCYWSKKKVLGSIPDLLILHGVCVFKPECVSSLQEFWLRPNVQRDDCRSPERGLSVPERSHKEKPLNGFFFSTRGRFHQIKKSYMEGSSQRSVSCCFKNEMVEDWWVAERCAVRRRRIGTLQSLTAPWDLLLQTKTDRNTGEGPTGDEIWHCWTSIMPVKYIVVKIRFTTKKLSHTNPN